MGERLLRAVQHGDLAYIRATVQDAEVRDYLVSHALGMVRGDASMVPFTTPYRAYLNRSVVAHGEEYASPDSPEAITL